LERLARRSHAYDRIDTLETEKKTATEQCEAQLKAAHEKIAELTTKAKRFELTDHELKDYQRMLFDAKVGASLHRPRALIDVPLKHPAQGADDDGHP